MDNNREDFSTARGAEYRLPDGTIEIVFETHNERILTLREYPSPGSFKEAVATAEYEGENEAVAALPGAEKFGEGSIESDDSSEST